MKNLFEEEVNPVSVFGDQDMIDAMTIAGSNIEAGTRKFDDYAKAMVDEVGEWVKPFLKLFYTGIRDSPGMEEIVDDMDSYEYVQMFDLDSLFTNRG